jgi:hypothetical protein
MPRIDPLFPTFNAGELSPRIYARLDFTKYPAGLEECLNLLPLPEGGLERRVATRFVAEALDSNKKVRIRPFEASATQQHVLEMFELGIRFYFRQGQLFVAQTDASITNGDFTSSIADWDDRSTGGAGNQISHDATNGRLTLETSGVADDDIGWAEQDITTTNLDQEHVIKFRVVGDPGDRIEFQVGTTSTGTEILTAQERRAGFHCIAFTPTASPFYVQFRNLGANADKDVFIDDVEILSNEAVEIDSPYLEEDLFDLVGAQSADVQYIFHGETRPYKLERRGLSTWSLIAVDWEDGPYLDENITDTTLDPAAVTGLGITIGASSTEGINDGRGFLDTDIGRLIRIGASGSEWGYAIIVGRTDELTVSVDVKKDFALATATTVWRLGAWSDTTGWPRTGGFFEQRLYVAATDNQPQTLWASQTGDFENFKPDDDNNTVEDDDALDFTLSADEISEIIWMSSGEDTLAIGTTGGEWVPSAQGIVITPLDITIRRQTTHGCARVQPLRVGDIVLFTQRGGRRIREFGFNFETDGFKAPDMTRLAYHITRSGLVEIAYQQEPDSVVWGVVGDGRMLSMTYRREEDVVGWSAHKVGGSFNGGDAVVESIAAIAGADDSGQIQFSGERDEIWVVVKRTINGAQKRYIEVLERPFVESDLEQADAYYSDSIITFDSGTETLTAISNGQSTFVYTISNPTDISNLSAQINGSLLENGVDFTVVSATKTITLSTSVADTVVIGDSLKVLPRETAIAGLDHLEGESVKVWGDGAVLSDVTVSSGQINLVVPVNKAQIGLGYTHRMKTLKLEGGNPAGTALGKPKKIYGLTFSLLSSVIISYGSRLSELLVEDFRKVSDEMDVPVPLFTGDRTVEYPGDWQLDERIFIQGDEPAPFTLLAMVPEIDVQPRK